MILGYKCRYGNIEPETRTAGGTFAAMDLVKQDADDGKYTIVAAAGTKCAGLAISDGTDASEFSLLPALPGLVFEITINDQSNVDTASKRLILCQKLLALVGTTGIQELDEDKTDADLLKVEDVVWNRDIQEYTAWCSIYYAASERFIEPS